MLSLKGLYEKWVSIHLIIRILAGIAIGVALALLAPGFMGISILGDLFIGCLKAVAPFLVFFLVMSSLASSAKGLGPRFGTVMMLYIGSTVVAAIVAVMFSYGFHVTVTFTDIVEDVVPPSGLAEMFSGLLLSMVENPLSALLEGNYLSILFWAAIIGFVIRSMKKPAITEAMGDLASVLTLVVRVIIQFAPFGIMGLIYDTVSENGLEIFVEYGSLIVLLLSAMLVVMFVTNPLIASAFMRANPYPLLIRCLRDSGLTAFFTRSSAANIPVNMALCERLGLDQRFYSVSIPLGATINMNGAAVTITCMSLTAAFTLGMDVPMMSAIPLCILATIAACGASGVAGGSLLLIPMACSFLGIPDEVAMQMVAIGFIIGVIQDSVETALNSSSDVLYTAVAEVNHRLKNGEDPGLDMDR